MEVEGIEVIEIKKYFNLDTRIEGMKLRKKLLREMFYSQTMAVHTEFDGKELLARGFNVDANVVPFIDAVANLDKKIVVLEKKKRYLNDYLNSLDSDEKDYLKTRYTSNSYYPSFKESDRHLITELKEIEATISFMYGKSYTIIDNLETSITREINNDNLFNDFNQISNILGV